MARRSTNALTKAYLDSLGVPCETVQSWRGRVRRDLFWIADTVALFDHAQVWIQNCCYGSLKAHWDKINENPIAPKARSLGILVELWEWRRVRQGRKFVWRFRVKRYPSGAVGDWKDTDLR